MIVSHNELVAAVNKAFLGMRRTCGEADVVANMVADLQMAGLDGVRHFNNGSRFIRHEQDSPVDIQQIADNQIEVNLHGSSLACHLPVIIDYALEKMVGFKSLSLTINHCHNRWLAYGELVKLAAKGIACRAQWENGASPKRILCVLDRGSISPELFFSDASSSLQDDVRRHSMTIEFSVKDFDIAQGAMGYETHIEAKELAMAHHAAWHEGIVVDDKEWQALKQTATVFLVENSEQSIRGAGELV